MDKIVILIALILPAVIVIGFWWLAIRYVKKSTKDENKYCLHDNHECGCLLWTLNAVQ